MSRRRLSQCVEWAHQRAEFCFSHVLESSHGIDIEYNLNEMTYKYLGRQYHSSLSATAIRYHPNTSVSPI